jgi:hypothetical protein
MMVQRLTGQAQLAAQSGDCRTVDALGDRVRALDPDYYARIFKTDPVIAGCVPLARPDSAETASPKRRPGSGGLRTGAYMLGIGVVVFGAAVLIGQSSAAIGVALIMGTAGVVLAGIALIVLLISAIIYYTSSST